MPTPIPRNDAPLTAAAAAQATGGRMVRRGAGDTVRGIVSDSRAATPGCAFVALRGRRHDGHEFLGAALAAGASLLVVERGRAPELPASAGLVEVDDTLVAWGDLARVHVRNWRTSPGGAALGAGADSGESVPARAPAADGRPAASSSGGAAMRRALFAVTGSAGKTTTKEICAALAGRIASCHRAAGNLNNRIGVPAVAFGLSPQHRFGAFEVAMSVRGEIAALARVLEPDVGVVTNAGLAHADGVGGTRADVAREKGDLFAALGPDAVAVACFDDRAVMQQIERTHAGRVVTFGIGAGADYRLLDRTAAGWQGCRLRVGRPAGGPLDSVHLPLPGEAAALDFLAALAAVEAAAGPLEAAAIDAAIGDLRGLPGRMQPRVLSSGTMILDDTYNANPESVRAALCTLRELSSGRRAIVVLGEMRELGPRGGEEHALVGGAVADAGARIFVSCGGLADRAAVEAERRGVLAIRAAGAEEAAQRAAALVAPGDVVLVKASRSIGAERVVETLVACGGGERGVGTP